MHLRYYEGGCVADKSSKGRTSPGCEGKVGECNPFVLYRDIGGSTKSGLSMPLPAATSARLTNVTLINKGMELRHYNGMGYLHEVWELSSIPCSTTGGRRLSLDVTPSVGQPANSSRRGGEPTTHYDELVTFASWMVALWPMGVPLVFSLLLWRARKAISGASAPTAFAGAIGILYREYDRRVFWWELVELVRRLVLVGFLQFIPDSYAMLRLLVAIWTSIVYLSLVLIVRPFKRDDDNALAITAASLLLATFFAGQLIYLNDELGPDDARRVLGLHNSYVVALVMVICGFVYVGLVGFALVYQSYMHAMGLRRKLYSEDLKCVADTIVASRGQMVHPCVLLSYEKLVGLGRLVSHEELRDRGLLKMIDLYDELRSFAEMNPIVFCSHEWLAKDEPDPNNVHFSAIVAACASLCAQQGISEGALYVWIDIASVPQKSAALQQLAINTLATYASTLQYFLIIAPPAEKEGFGTRDIKTYSLRGWCRLEQFGRLASPLGEQSIFLYDGQAKIRPAMAVQDDGSYDLVWLRRAIAVFEGDFTVEDDKQKLVKAVLGLFARILTHRERPEMARLLAAIQESKDKVFPPEYFRTMPAMMERALGAEAQGRKGMVNECFTTLARLFGLSWPREAAPIMPKRWVGVAPTAGASHSQETRAAPHTMTEVEIIQES